MGKNDVVRVYVDHLKLTGDPKVDRDQTVLLGRTSVQLSVGVVEHHDESAVVYDFPEHLLPSVNDPVFRASRRFPTVQDALSYVAKLAAKWIAEEEMQTLSLLPEGVARSRLSRLQEFGPGDVVVRTNSEVGNSRRDFEKFGRKIRMGDLEDF